MILLIVLLIIVVAMAFLMGAVSDGNMGVTIGITLSITLLICGCIRITVYDFEQITYQNALKCAENGIECVVRDQDDFAKWVSKEALYRASTGGTMDIVKILGLVKEK